ncbi:uncharacterized protein N0V89_001763 [Didymosphaeria variabile]|uniref:Uncharacterized protein n=1 Tax=Didymosphaeria variabile TaxID=1932322 RepID=A0A9W9CE20_9PLEO|nr:uncharacterized protein N0V89_001763 [Didymosphaeria variabile]KAJ4357188.1 hypothetical protein N0V89_001763 [Didymosphaeria variabile]
MLNLLHATPGLKHHETCPEIWFDACGRGVRMDAQPDKDYTMPAPLWNEFGATIGPAGIWALDEHCNRPEHVCAVSGYIRDFLGYLEDTVDPDLTNWRWATLPPSQLAQFCKRIGRHRKVG